MENKKIIGVVFVSFVLAVFAISLVSAVSFRQEVGVSPGQTVTENLRLQNLAPGEGDLLFVGEFVDDGGVASFKGSSTFTVENGKIIDAPLRLSVPSDAEIGQRYTISMIWRNSPVDPVADDNSDGGAISFATGVGISFDVVVVEQGVVGAQAGGSGVLLGVIVVLIVIIIIVLIFILNARKGRR